MSNNEKTNILAENMRRFNTKNLNERDDTAYKADQEHVRLNNIADDVVTQLRAMSTHDIDVVEDELMGNTSYTISQTIPSSRFSIKKSKSPKMVLAINPSKDDAGNYVNVDSGKLYVEFEHEDGITRNTVIDYGSGMFGADDTSVVNQILDIAKKIFKLN